jgi:hypothetical protein
MLTTTELPSRCLTACEDSKNGWGRMSCDPLGTHPSAILRTFRNKHDTFKTRVHLSRCLNHLVGPRASVRSWSSGSTRATSLRCARKSASTGSRYRLRRTTPLLDWRGCDGKEATRKVSMQARSVVRGRIQARGEGRRAVSRNYGLTGLRNSLLPASETRALIAGSTRTKGDSQAAHSWSFRPNNPNRVRPRTSWRSRSWVRSSRPMPFASYSMGSLAKGSPLSWREFRQTLNSGKSR